MIINHEHSVLTGDQLLAYNAYLTIDQSDVKAGVMQRKPGAHVDGFQGARVYPKTLIQYKVLEDNEKELIIAADIEVMEYYLSELKKLDVVHYYNFCYIGLLSESIDAVKLILKNLLMDGNPVIQSLRLLFIAATQTNTQAAHFGKIALIAHFSSVKQNSRRNLFLDFMLEIITQKPLLLSREIVRKLIDGDEHTPQGREILKFIKFGHVNSSGFWKTQKSGDATDDIKPRRLMSKL